ncbi:MAG: glycosidase [Psychromonas sp.]|jgi:glycosidase|uniref:alpha-amylase family glycosyl hydrolase n=1 Tax=Psychromonas sp. TaxID=1884585 RepID=UPI0039E64126
MKHSFSKITLALTLALNLAACGTGIGLTQTPNTLSASDENIVIEVKQASSDKDQRLACYQGNAAVSKRCGLVTYQIMVESFVDGDTTVGQGTGYGTSHHQGDLQGIIDSIDYIKDLGANAIWLTPIFESTPIAGQNKWIDRLDATGYFTSDYFKIDPHFGDLATAKKLVKKAHAKGLYVFFDGVFGHHKSNVAASPNGLTPTNGNDQGGVGFESSYPQDLSFYKEVVSYWINELKIDGWRLDQAYQVPVAQWAALRKTVEKTSKNVTYKNAAGEMVNPLGYMVAEIWKGENEIAASGYGTDNNPALHSAFDFPMRYKVLQTFAVDENGAGKRGAETLNEGFNSHLAYPDHAMPNLMLGNHDLVRFGDLLQRGGISEPDDDQYWAIHKAAFSFMGAYSGPVTLYYGDEIGDEVPDFAEKVNNSCAELGLCDDHVARSSAKIEGVSVSQLSPKQAELKAYVASIMKIRHSNPALYNGARTHIFSDHNLYIDRKDTANNHVLYLLNVKDKRVKVALSGAAIGSDGILSDLQSGKAYAQEGAVYNFTLKPFEAKFLNIASPAEGGPKTSAASTITGEGFMAACDNPNDSTLAPIGKDMYIRGSYAGGNGFSATPASHKFSYKGQNTYQVTVNEAQVTAYTFKFASADWSIEMAVDESAAVQLGQEQSAAVAAGPGTESSIAISQPGNYVFSFNVNSDGSANKMMVSKCVE